MTNETGDLKKEVAEIKFLIHDLRVERFINEVIHFHVTLNTDLEIYSIEQAQILHGHDLQVLKEKAVSLRRAFHEYSNAVKNFSPDHTIIQAGRNYIDTIRSTCALILNPLWGRVDNVLTFLPPDSRSARGRELYRNCIHWIGGVSQRIEHFLEEEHAEGVYEEFDIGSEIEQFTLNVVRGYVAEASHTTVELQLDNLDSAIVGGNRYRFRRMYFNMVMNSVDAVAGPAPGTLHVSNTVEGRHTVLAVRDNGVGMSPAKIEQLLTDRESLDGELHSLGFVFVRQTIRAFRGDLSIDSKVGSGTTVTVRFPILATTRLGTPRPLPMGEKTSLSPPDSPPVEAEPPPAPPPAGPVNDEKNSACGRLIREDYEASTAQYPGCIFAIAVTESGRVNYFTHRPYDRWWNMNHEDLSPTCHEATLRGRLEEDDEKRPVLILKEPHDSAEYFDFKGIPASGRNEETHLRMVRDEYVRVARKLLETGLPADTGVELSGLQKFFPGRDDLAGPGPLPLRLLADQLLSFDEPDGAPGAP